MKKIRVRANTVSNNYIFAELEGIADVSVWFKIGEV